MNLIAKKIIASLLVVTLASIAFSQVSLTTIPTTSLGSILQSNTSFVDSVYRESNGTFQPSFTAGGLTWTKVGKNFSSFNLNTPLDVTVIDVNYTEQIPYDIGVTYGTKTLKLWNNLNNSNGFSTNTITLSSTSPTTNVSFFSQTHRAYWFSFVDDVQTYQSDKDGWAFYNVAGTNTYLGFAEVGLHSGVDYNDGVFLIQTAVPEPSTYAALLGMMTLGIVAIRRYRQRSC